MLRASFKVSKFQGVSLHRESLDRLYCETLNPYHLETLFLSGQPANTCRDHLLVPAFFACEANTSPIE